jgi:hypothetical protein
MWRDRPQNPLTSTRPSSASGTISPNALLDGSRLNQYF